MILGIESSCDESALALFDPARGISGEWVHSQIALHEAYGGVVPDLASREHLDKFPVLLKEAAKHPDYARVTQIAVTNGPGLAGCLAMGIALAKALGIAKGAPVTGVNHLRGHVWSPFLELHAREPKRFWDNLAPLLPHVGLLVSGGNTLLFKLEAGGKITLLNRTVDDAAGEALDKGAKLLGLPYPGGALIEKRAANGNAGRFDFPRALGDHRKREVMPFSFSGLKTSLRYRLEKMAPAEIEKARGDLCASYQAAVVEQLAFKTEAALEELAGQGGGVRSLGLSGGVANNAKLREAMAAIGKRHELPLLVAKSGHTGDNAAMIGFAAWADPGHALTSTAERALTFEPSLALC